MTSLTFLGTGGGRFATIYQVRSTGGIYLQDGARFHLDPGPSALIRMRDLALDPGRTDGVLISHCHPDHYADAEMLIEGMTRGGFKRRGTIIGPRSVLKGGDGFTQAVSSYHQSIAHEVIMANPGEAMVVKGMTMEVTPTFHSDPMGVGYRFHTTAGPISYVGDTEMHDGLIAPHRGSRVLIINLTRPLGARAPMHMVTEDAASLVAELKPEAAVLTHFGMKLVHDGVDVQARHIENASGVRTIAAEDLMTIRIGKDIRTARLKGKSIFKDVRDLDR